MSLIVDTYNVLHTVGVLPPEIAGVDRAGLAELIGRSRYRHQRVTLVCDGVAREDAPRGRIGGVSFRYAGADRTADDVIAQIIRRSSSPRRLTVVSSDRAVLREARRRRCNLLRSEEFLEHLAKDHETPKPSAADALPRQPPTGADPGRILPHELLREAESITEADVSPDVPPPRQTPRGPTGSGQGSNAAQTPAGSASDRGEETVSRPPAPARKPRPSFLPQDLIAEAESLLADEEREQAETERQRREEEQARRDRESDPADQPDAAHRRHAPAEPAPYRNVLPEELIAGAEELAGIDPDKLDADLEDRFADAADEAEDDGPPRIPAHMPDDVLAEAESLWDSGGTDEPLPMRLSKPAEPPATPRPSGEVGPTGPGSGVPRPPEPPKNDDETKGDSKPRGKRGDRGRRGNKPAKRGADRPRGNDRAPSTDEPHREHGR
jgi:hypothetical protein